MAEGSHPVAKPRAHGPMAEAVVSAGGDAPQANAARVRGRETDASKLPQVLGADGADGATTAHASSDPSAATDAHAKAADPHTKAKPSGTVHADPHPGPANHGDAHAAHGHGDAHAAHGHGDAHAVHGHGDAHAAHGDAHDVEPHEAHSAEHVPAAVPPGGGGGAVGFAETDVERAMLKSWEEGKAEARAEARADDVLTVLRVRGIALPDAARDRILVEKDVTQLKRWLEKAAVASSIEEVIGSVM
jgi:hypothetical protein